MFNKECGEYALRSSGINHWSHENRGNNHQLKKRLIVRQILLVISIGKEWKIGGRIFIKMFWDRGSRENSINNPLLGGRDTCIYGGFGWLPLPPPFPPSPVCFFLSKQLTIFRLRKTGKYPLFDRVWPPLWKISVTPQNIGLCSCLIKFYKLR